MNEDKVKEKLGDDATSALATVEEGLSWLADNQEEKKETYAEKQKEYSDKVQPILAKLYADSKESPVQGTGPGPVSEEVD